MILRKSFIKTLGIMINSAFYNYLPRIIDFYHTVKTLNVFNKIQTFVQVGAHDGYA